MMSWYGNTFCITGPLWGESISHWWIPHTKGPYYIALMDPLMSTWISCWISSWAASDLRWHENQGQTITWTNSGILLIGPWGTILNDISVENHIFSFKKMHLKNVICKMAAILFQPKCAKMETRQIWGIWKLRPAYSPETPNSGQKRWCFVPCDLEIWWMTLENNRAPLLCCFKLCATFHNHQWIQTGVAVQKRPISVKFDDF